MVELRRIAEGRGVTLADLLRGAPGRSELLVMLVNDLLVELRIARAGGELAYGLWMGLFVDEEPKKSEDDDLGRFIEQVGGGTDQERRRAFDVFARQLYAAVYEHRGRMAWGGGEPAEGETRTARGFAELMDYIAPLPEEDGGGYVRATLDWLLGAFEDYVYRYPLAREEDRRVIAGEVTMTMIGEERLRSELRGAEVR